MIFNVLTLFPEMIDTGLNHSIIKRAIENKIINVNAVNIRDFADNKHNHIDDYPYGGGSGMVMQAEPIYKAYNSILNNVNEKTKVIYMTPKGKVFNQQMAQEFAKEDNLIILCGHYEGVDQRIIEEIVTDEVSIGDFVLTGGELGAMILIDCVSRLLSGVLGSDNSSVDESFSNGMLEYPQYTRPKEFMGRAVPEVLLSGNHKNIENWRKLQSLLETCRKRPDLVNFNSLSKGEILFLRENKVKFKGNEY